MRSFPHWIRKADEAGQKKWFGTYINRRFMQEYSFQRRGMTMPYDLPEDPELTDMEAACRQIIEDNSAVFLGYYGNETAEKLEEVHEQLVEAGYLELIEAVNAERGSE